MHQVLTMVYTAGAYRRHQGAGRILFLKGKQAVSKEKWREGIPGRRENVNSMLEDIEI